MYICIYAHTKVIRCLGINLSTPNHGNCHEVPTFARLSERDTQFVLRIARSR